MRLLSSRARPSELRSSIVVAALSAAFGVTLIQATSFMATAISADDVGGRAMVQVMLAMVASVFIVIAAYVGAIVTANTFATVVAGRTRTIALMRLVGSTAAAQRTAVAREGLAVGLVGAAAGGVVGLFLSFGGIRLAVAAGTVPSLNYALVDPLALLPVLTVIATTWASSWVGSRRVLMVSPIDAIATTQEATRDELVRRPVRNAVAAVLFVGGLAVMALGVVVGMTSPWGLIIAFFGGIVSFTGLVAGASLFMPPALYLAGRLLGRSAASRMAAENALRYPERSTRTTIGIVIGVTLITTFVVAAQGLTDMLMMSTANQPQDFDEIKGIMAVTMAVFSALIGFSAVIAGFGMVNNLSLSVLQRTRELGLLRALGFTGRQVRGMIIAESAQMTIAAVGLGLVLGVLYGWAGAQSLLGGLPDTPPLVWPSVPWPLVVAMVVGAALVTFAAAQAPAKRAVSVTPVVALTVE